MRLFFLLILMMICKQFTKMVVHINIEIFIISLVQFYFGTCSRTHLKLKRKNEQFAGVTFNSISIASFNNIFIKIKFNACLSSALHCLMQISVMFSHYQMPVHHLLFLQHPCNSHMFGESFIERCPG